MKDSRSHKITVLTAVLLAVALLLSACGQRTPADETEPSTETEETVTAPVKEGSLTLPYTSLDSVNPFFVDSLLNSTLTPLVFRALYYLDGGFTPVAQLAAGETCSPTGVRVTLADNVVFSDGAPMTSADVVYSFEKAKKAPLYAEALRGVERCEADGNYAVLFSLKEVDVNALNLLTFPVVRQGTAETEEAFPVGCGFFVYSRDDLRVSLQPNPQYEGAVPQISSIRLYDITDTSSLMHLLDTGGIDCFYTDLSEGTAKRSFSGASEIYLNNLVFLGVNAESYRLSSADVRRAISLAVSRAAICENAFLSHARAAFYPMNTSWEALSRLTRSAAELTDADPVAADALLATVGAGFDGDALSYRLICVDRGTFMPAAAKLIAEQLATVNIRVSVELLSGEDFEKALKDGEYDLYLSEIKLTKNMDLTPFFSARGAASWGLDLGTLTSDNRYADYRAQRLELEEFLNVFSEETPFIPLLFRNGQFCFSRSVKGGVEAAEDDLFINIADWSVG